MMLDLLRLLFNKNININSVETTKCVEPLSEETQCDRLVAWKIRCCFFLSS